MIPRNGPPDDAAREGSPTCPGTSVKGARQNPHRLPHRNAASRRGALWREGFAYGFRDALRLAAREIDDPTVLVVLAELADRYALAGSQ